LILLVLPLVHYVIFPGIELRFSPTSLRKNREIKNPRRKPRMIAFTQCNRGMSPRDVVDLESPLDYT